MPDDRTKRTEVYTQQPGEYEIAGCPANPAHWVTWSEFEHYLWCFDCETDFIPAHWGIFEGPIPLGAARLLGISFDRVEIATGRIIKFEEPEE